MTIDPSECPRFGAPMHRGLARRAAGEEARMASCRRVVGSVSWKSAAAGWPHLRGQMVKVRPAVVILVGCGDAVGEDCEMSRR